VAIELDTRPPSLFSSNANRQLPSLPPSRVNVMPLSGQQMVEPLFFAKVPNIDVNVQAIVHIHFHALSDDRRVIEMNKFLSLDLQDVPVMLGSATFIGSVVGVAWKLALSSAAPTSVVILAATAGLACGRLLSLKAKANR